MTDVAVVAMDAEQARTLTAEIQGRVTGLLPLIREAFERRADLALGYGSWTEYCAEELDGIRIPVGDRPELVTQLRESGMSTRAIGAALGVDAKTVRNDLNSTGEKSPVESVKSLDGRERPATMPERAKPVTMPARQADADTITTAIDEHVATRAAVADAMDTHLPPDTDAPRRAWNIAFLTALRPTFKLMAQFTPTAVAETADEECLDELASLAKQLESYLDKVRTARPLPDNVRHLRVAS